MKKKIDYAWVKANAKYYGFDGYGFSIYQYGKLFITVDEHPVDDKPVEILAIEYEG